MLWVLSFVAALLTLVLNPWDHRLTFTQDCRFGVWSGFGSVDPVLVFFNEDLGPYRGSLITVEGDPQPPVVTRVDWEFPRIYYRHIRGNGFLTWTLMVSLWYPMTLLAIGPLVWRVSRQKHTHAQVEPNPKQASGKL
jgi:hypothetical protein